MLRQQAADFGRRLAEVRGAGVGVARHSLSLPCRWPGRCRTAGCHVQHPGQWATKQQLHVPICAIALPVCAYKLNRSWASRSARAASTLCSSPNWPKPQRRCGRGSSW